MLEMQWFVAKRANAQSYIELKNAGICNDSSHQVAREHGTTSYNLHLVCDGQGYVKQGSLIHELRKSDLFFYQAGEAENYGSSLADAWTVRWIHFTAPFAQAWFDSLGILPYGILHVMDIKPFIEKHESLLQVLRSGEIADDNLTAEAVFACLQAAFSQSSLTAKNVKPEHSDTLDRVHDFIIKHLEQPLDLSMLADVACLSQSRLSHLYKANFGESPMMFVRKRRISLAKNLLSNNKFLSIAEVGRRCGYPDDSHFCRVFHTVCGQSPMAFRQSWP